MATTETYAPSRIYSIPLAELLPDPNQSRKYFDSKSQPHISETFSLARLPQEIRDECRTDPAVPKKTLLTIAKGKQQRGMLTAYRQYKDRLNAQKTPRTAAKATQTEKAVYDLSAAENRLARLDLLTLSAEDKDIVVRAATDLMEFLRKFIADAAPPTPAAPSKPAAAPKATSKTATVKKKTTVKTPM